MLNALFWKAAGMSLACSAVLLPLLMASRLVSRRYSARTCYALWLLLALRLILPFQITLPAKTVTVEVPQYEVTLPHTQTNGQLASAKPHNSAQDGTATAPAAVGSAAMSTVSLTKLLPLFWRAGMAACGLWLVLSYALVRRSLLQKAEPAAPEEEHLLDALVEELSCKRCPALRRSDRVSTPMLLGLVRPVVLLPIGELPEEELSVMLRHELTHLRRHDVAYKLVLQFACMVHWFNPLVWWMSREAGRNLELCCDEDVVRGRDNAFRRIYGDVLLKTAAGVGRAPILSARMGGGKGYLKVRLNNLFFKKKNSAALVCVVLSAAILGGSLVACNGEGPEKTPNEDGAPLETSFRSPEELRKKLEKWNAAGVDVNVTVDLGDGTDAQKIQDMQTWWEKKAAEAVRDSAAVCELAESVTADENGSVIFTVPEYAGESHWNIELRGRMAADGMDGMSFHYGYDHLEDAPPGCPVVYPFGERWTSVTEMYLWVSLGDVSVTVDLLGETPEAVGSIEVEPWPYGVSEMYYCRDKGGSGGDFYIRLSQDGSFTYYAGMLSSYIGHGKWTRDGDVICLADEGLKDSAGIQYFYFRIVEDGLLFQKENSAEFMYVDVEDGDRFTNQPIAPAYSEPPEE